MGVGGSHKAMSGSCNRGRPYGLMLLLALGAALLGVMLLHKLRERRIFTLLVKEKDHRLISLQLLLQKEKEYNKDLKNKNEEIKAKISTLSTQKMELDRRLLEMQSTVDSLKDEQKTLESALEEMKNEIKMRKEAEIASAKENSQLTALKESLKQKEAEIEDLKHNVGFLIEVPVNLTDSSRGQDGQSSKFTYVMEVENSTRVEDGSDKGLEVTSTRELTVEQLPEVEISHEDDFKNSVVRESVHKGGSDVGKQMNISNSMEATANADESVSKLGEKNSNGQDHNESEITEQRVLRNAEHSQDESQEVQTNSEGGKNLEIVYTRIDAGSRLRGKHGHVDRTKGRRWRMLARSRDPAYNRLLPGLNRRFHRLARDELRRKRESQNSNDKIGEGEKRAADEKPQEVRKAVDTEYLGNRDKRAEQQKLLVEQENEMFKFHDSTDMKLQRNITVDDEPTKNLSHAEKQKPDEEEGNDTEQEMSSGNSHEEENIGKQVKDDNKPEITDEVEDDDMQAKEAESIDGDSVRKSNSNPEEDQEEYKEKIDASEF